MRVIGTVFLAAFAALLGGCRAQYTTPGGPADFRALGITAQHADALTDGGIRERMNRKPAASFPAVVAVVRVQDGRYRSYSLNPNDIVTRGEFSIISKRDVENSVDMATLRNLPGLRDIAMLNRLVMPVAITDNRDLRASAADIHADILFLYTFDTRFGSETKVPFLGSITLGLFPAEQARVSTTCSGAFIDTRTGYIYGLVEASADDDQLANLWTTKDATDQTRRRAESKAFKEMVEQAKETWKRIVSEYGPRM
ncbi:MAG: hypothetical protein ACKVZJ_07000 [Phycisphaerales bacterium]